MLNKKFMLIAIFLVSLLAISAVSATDLNETDEIATEEIAMDDNFDKLSDNDLLQEDNQDELKDPEDTVYTVCEVVNKPNEVGDSNVTFKFTDYQDSPLVNIDLGVSLNEGDVEKITTDSRGVAVYSHNFFAGSYKLEVGLWDNGIISREVGNIYFWPETVDFYIIPIEVDVHCDYPVKTGDNITFKCVNAEDNSPVPNLDLAFILDSGDWEKVTADSKGIAVYSHDFTVGNHFAQIALWNNGRGDSYAGNFYFQGFGFDFSIVPYAKLEIIHMASEYGDNNVTFRVTNIETNAPMANVDLGVLDKTNYKGYKITTNSEGIAVWMLPFKLGSCTILVGLGDDESISSQTDDLYCEGIRANISITSIPASLKLTKTGNGYKSTTLTESLTDSLNKPLANENVIISFSNGKSKTVTTNSKGVATYSLPFNPGTYTATVNVASSYIKANEKKLSIVISKAAATITPTKLSTTYGSGKYFQVKVVNSKTKNPLVGVKLNLKVATGKKYKTVTITTDSKGIAKYSASTLALGTHKVTVTSGDAYVKASSKTSSIKVSKAAITISAPKATNEYKKSQTFKVTVKNKESGKGMSGIKVTMKVYTGSKYKTFTAKTNSKGVASFNTKSLSKATHKVVINVKGTSKYKAASAKSSVKIVKSKIATHFELEELYYNYASNGVFSGVSVDLKLLDSSGKEVGFQTVKLQIMRSDSGSAYGDEVSVLSNTGSHEVSCRLTGADCYLKASFAGDSTYKSCTYTYNL